MRSIWKGHIRFSLVTIPVRAYNGIETSESIKLNQVHRGCGGLVGVRRYCKSCGETVEMPGITKGFNPGGDEAVVELSDEELSSIQLRSTKIVDCVAFLPLRAIDPRQFDAPYLLGPDGKVAEPLYGLLRTALSLQGTAGMGKVVLRDREEPVAIYALGSVLVMQKLRYPAEMRATAELELSAETPAPEALTMCTQLIDSLSVDSLTDVELVDHYQVALRELIDQKLAGVAPVAPKPDQPQNVIDIMDALKASIAAARSAKPKRKVA